MCLLGKINPAIVESHLQALLRLALILPKCVQIVFQAVLNTGIFLHKMVTWMLNQICSIRCWYKQVGVWNTLQTLSILLSYVNGFSTNNGYLSTKLVHRKWICEKLFYICTHSLHALQYIMLGVIDFYIWYIEFIQLHSVNHFLHLTPSYHMHFKNSFSDIWYCVLKLHVLYILWLWYAH